MSIDQGRLDRGREIVLAKGVTYISPGHWMVRSPDSTSTWDVDQDMDGNYICGCPDNVMRHKTCKHIVAVLIHTGNLPTKQAEVT